MIERDKKHSYLPPRSSWEEQNPGNRENWLTDLIPNSTYLSGRSLAVFSHISTPAQAPTKAGRSKQQMQQLQHQQAQQRKQWQQHQQVQQRQQFQQQKQWQWQQEQAMRQQEQMIIQQQLQIHQQQQQINLLLQ